MNLPYNWYEGALYSGIPNEVLDEWIAFHEDKDGPAYSPERVGMLRFIREFRDWPPEARLDFAATNPPFYATKAEWDEHVKECARRAIEALGIPMRKSE